MRRPCSARQKSAELTHDQNIDWARKRLFAVACVAQRQGCINRGRWPHRSVGVGGIQLAAAQSRERKRSRSLSGRLRTPSRSSTEGRWLVPARSGRSSTVGFKKSTEHGQPRVVGASLRDAQAFSALPVNRLTGNIIECQSSRLPAPIRKACSPQASVGGSSISRAWPNENWPSSTQRLL